jgi:DNA uptake protein ComE-like DNA-binding protein
VLYSRLGPQLRCDVAGRTVRLVGLGTEAPLSMDVNTAEEGIMRLVPGITDAEVASWLAARARAPFASVEDFKARAGLADTTRGSLKF